MNMRHETVTRVPILLLAAVLLAFVPFRSGAEPVLEPYTFSANFESGSVGSWSSYPPAQDTAYDPTIWVKPLYVDRDAPNRALYREVTPNWELDYIFGVRKKLDMYITAESRLSFKASIKSNREVRGVKVLFGFADGGSVERMVSFTARETWRDCSVPLVDMLDGVKARKLDAVAFMAVCPDADPENLLRFGIDDVSVNGLQEISWRFTLPAVHELSEREDRIAAGHFTEGGSMVIAGDAQFQIGSAAVIVSRALTGGDERIIRMKRDGGEWKVTIPLSGKSGLTAGIWRATVRASLRDKKDDSITTSMVFLVRRADAPTTNPRILMGPGDGSAVLAKASSGRMKTVWENLQKRAERSRNDYDYNEFNYNLEAYDEKYWLPTYGGYVAAISRPTQYARANAVVSALSGETVAGDAARNALMKMAAWPSFVHPHILNQGQFTYWPVGQILADMAVAYDMVHERLTEQERHAISEALYTKGITEVFKEYVRDNRVSSNTSNWIGDVTGGGICCALAVMDEYPDTQLEPYLTGMILRMNDIVNGAFDRDGNYGEGYSYLNHAMHCLNLAMPGLERTFGIQFPDVFKNCHEFMLYQTNLSSWNIYDLGDTSERIGALSSFAWLVDRYRDPHFKWLYDKRPGSSDVDLLLLDDSLPAESPDTLPTLKLFRDTGTAVFRSGFTGDDFIFVFRCGPFYNHQHFDQGGFWLSDHGEAFLGEMGKSDYYNDPWYKKLIIQPGGHNCILVNGNVQSHRAGDILKDVPAWREYPVITDYMELPGGGFVSGRLEPLYEGKLDLLRRSALYIQPRTVILIDEIVGGDGAETAELRFHAPRRDDVTLSGATAEIARPAGTLTVRTVTPGVVSEVKKRPLTTSEFARENALTMQTRGFLEMTADLKKAGGAMTVVNVLTSEQGVADGLDVRNEDDHAVVTVSSRTYMINTKPVSGGRAEFTDGPVTTDALAYADLPSGYFAMNMTTLSRDGEALITSDFPVSVEFGDGQVMRLAYSAGTAAKLSVRLTEKPRQVTLDGEKIRSWRHSGGRLTLTIPAGTGVIGIR